MKKVICRIFGFILLFSVLVSQKVEASGTEFKDEWKNGVVEINAGVTDTDGRFHRLKHASGFLITNSEQNAYIVTLQSAISISNEEKNKWMKDNGLSEGISSYGINTSIRVVVKGDVLSEVTVVNQSANEDFAILKSESVIQEKTCLKIGNSEETKSGEPVYSLGFSDALAEQETAQYTKGDICVKEGKIDNSSFEVDGVNYVTYHSIIDSGEYGGPLMDEEGYVIGLNQKADTENSVVYALPINSIKDILNSYGIEYASKDLDHAYEKLQNLYDRGTEMLGERYQKKSLAEIRTELEVAKSVLESNTYEVEVLTEETEKLESIISQAVPKISRIRMVIIGLAVMILILVIYLIVISVKAKQLMSKKTNTTQKEQPKEIAQKRQVQNEVQYREERKSEKILSVQRSTAFLQRVSTGEKIVLGEGNLTIGKSAERVDYVIQGNKTISRVHAEIQRVGEDYEIIDRGSSNGTFVNGKRISGNGIKLQNQDEVRLSNEEFIFKKI